MARTRASNPAASADPAAAANPKSVHILPAQATSSPKLFVLPRAATRDAKVVTLPNPRYAKPTRYLACPETGLYEFTRISAPKTTPRSFLIETPVPTQDGEQMAQGSPRVDGQVVAGADLYIATPIDPLFLLIPALTAPEPKAKRMFVTSDDHFDKLPEEASHLSTVLSVENIRKLFEARMRCVCDTVQAGGETMFRINEGKLLGEILQKARRMAEGSLPLSMKEKFVTKALEAPILSQRRLPVRPTEPASADDSTSTPAASTPKTESEDSQASTDATESSTSVESQASTAPTSISEGPGEDTVKAAIEASEEVVALQQLKVAFDFIRASYLPPEISKRLAEMLKDETLSGASFAPLEGYLAQLAKLRADAMASRSVGDYSKKHSRDEEEDDAREAKKRKAEEEKKKKALESRGVRELKKVNTTGMRKMSDFFKKK
ncbi:uncharacterized protein DNG_07734 [Cephalotrichum gorgonifer]|uniref:Ribonuclease H2 subunit B n=1 Tax=Cephalotrichum gorgonifer TaxID=2041049 RepID=A0AAE8N3Z0_9PEZI|nr:uncharacterized protein DNG_07734 [Cephalotrichum gorgonifer]